MRFIEHLGLFRDMIIKDDDISKLLIDFDLILIINPNWLLVKKLVIGQPGANFGSYTYIFDRMELFFSKIIFHITRIFS